MKIYGSKKESIARAFRNSGIKIAVYGLGKMGLPLAAIFAEKGAKVIGIDIDKKVVDSINKGINHVREEPCLNKLVRKNVKSGNLRASVNPENADIHVILVPTLTDKNNKPILSPVFSVAKKISSVLEKNDIVITECTMPPSSTEKLIPILEKSGLKCGKDFGLAHCPERTMTGTAIRDITKQYPKIIGCIDKRTQIAVETIYSIINSKGVIPVSDIKTAECVKVFEGIYRDVNIALANELAIYCSDINVDATEIFNTANTQPYCHIHKPGPGVGGHCIPLYPYFIMNPKTTLIKTARKINDSMSAYTVKLTKEVLSKSKRKIKNSNILVLGLTFRSGVQEFRKTPAGPIIKELKKLGAKVFAYDPLCDDSDYKIFNVRKSSFKNMDCIVIVTEHPEFKNLDWDKIKKQMRTKILIDTRQIVNPSTIRKLGFIYKGIGRV